MELQVLIHGVDVVEDVSSNPRDDSHQLRVMQLALGSQSIAESGSGRDNAEEGRGHRGKEGREERPQLGDGHRHVCLRMEADN